MSFLEAGQYFIYPSHCFLLKYPFRREHSVVLKKANLVVREITLQYTSSFQPLPMQLSEGQNTLVDMYSCALTQLF